MSSASPNAAKIEQQRNYTLRWNALVATLQERVRQKEIQI